MQKPIFLTYFGCLCGFVSLLFHTASAQSLTNIEDNALTFTEGQEPIQLTENVKVNGNTPINYAVVAFEAGYVADEDTLLYSGAENVFSVFDEESGRLYLLSYPAGTSLSGADMQTALRSVFYQNTNIAQPEPQRRTVSMTVYNQNDAASNSLSRNINILQESDPPLLRSTANAPVVVFTIVSPQAVAQDVVLTDPDDDFIIRAEITDTDFEEGDVLFYQAPPSSPISAVNEGLRRLVLTGRATKAQYQEALRNVFIVNNLFTRGLDPEKKRSILIRVFDENNLASRNLQRDIIVRGIAPVQTPPSVVDLADNTEQNQVFNFSQQQFAQAYNDQQEPQLESIRILSLPDHGLLSLNGEVIDANFVVVDEGIINRSDLNQLAYTPDPGFFGSDQFEWNASDGIDLAANPAYVTISVKQAPVLLSLSVPPSAEVDEDGATVLPPILVEASASLTLNVELTVQNGQLSLNSALLSLVNGLSSGSRTHDDDDDGDSSNDNDDDDDDEDEKENGGGDKNKGRGGSEEQKQNNSDLAFSVISSVVRYLLSGIQYQPDENVVGSDQLSVVVRSLDEREEGIMNITIVPVDDPILLSNIEVDTLVYQEHSPPATITNEIALSDPDGVTIVRSATITVPEGLSEEDQITYTLIAGVSAEQIENQVQFSGEGSLEQYQSIFRSVAYENSSEAPLTTFLTFEFQALDENDSVSNLVSRTLVVVPVDDSTVLSTSEPEILNYVLRSGEIPIHSTVLLSDVDSDSLTRLTVAFETSYNAALDTILVDVSAEQSVSWDDGNGILEVTGKNSLAIYQTIIRSLRFRYSANEGQPNRRILLQVFNDDTPSNILTRTVQIIENDRPLLSDFQKKVVQSDSLIFSLEDFLGNYNDPDDFPNEGQFSSLRIVSLPTQGVLSMGDDTIKADEIDSRVGGFFLNAENISQLQYRPNPDYVGEDTFSWNAFDGAELAENSAMVELTIVPGLTISVTDSVTICPGETTELTVEVLTGAEPFTYSWSCDREDCRINSAVNGTAIIVSPIESTNYIIWVGGAEGLDSVQDTIAITVRDCSDVDPEIPSAFTPNEDNINDQWEFPNAVIFTRIQLRVYNRYGQTVFESANYQNNWDGTYEGNNLPVGTYYYTVLADPGAKEYTGTVTLLR
ncbi:MAG: gliding motility-associated C-terminal domain-containing protein [Cyclobacteriaceae bacterium]